MAVLAADITASQRSLELEEDTALATYGGYYRIESEVVRITNFGRARGLHGAIQTRKWSVRRGELGTTPATHSAGAEVKAMVDAFAVGENLTRPAPFAGTGEGGSGVIVDNGDEEVVCEKIIATGASFDGTTATLATPVEVFRRTVTLTDAQIKALPTTAVEIIPAPGADKILYPFAAALRLNWVADYTNIHESAKLALTRSTTTANNPVHLAHFDEVDIGLSGLLALGSSAFAFTGPRLLSATDGDLIRGSAGWSEFDVINVALNLRATSSGGDFTGGDAGNSLTVTVLYTIMDLG